MAPNTPPQYRNLVIYEVYVRNHGPNGNFADVEADLPRIKSMGVDIVWFMPIHPIGRLNKKGNLGCPYSIADYRRVNPEYGTLQDFVHLIESAHQLGLKVMIDVVFNHTSHDSLLVHEHPAWFHQDANGKPVTTVLAWGDVIDLKHPNPELSKYLIDCLKYWAEIGVDGFRCDVASIVPIDFWLRARSEVEQVKPGVIWLAESVHADFVSYRRSVGLYAISDAELFQAFDMEYDYDIWPVWQSAVTQKAPITHYLDLLRFQDCMYPASYVKMRCVENHDQPRIMRLAPTRIKAMAWTAFQAFNKGTFLIYGGQETGTNHTPSLFDIDKIIWGTYELQPFLSRLAFLKKHPASKSGKFIITDSTPMLQAAWFSPSGNSLYGVFNVTENRQLFKVQLSDGIYRDLLNDQDINVFHGRMDIPQYAAILEVKMDQAPLPYASDFFHFEMPPE